MDHPNRALAERAWQAVAASDVDTLRKLWTPDIVWHVTTENPWTGDHVGTEAVLDYLAAVGEAGEAYDARIEDMLASDRHVLLVYRVRARRGRHSLDAGQCLLARVEGDRIAEVWTLPLDPAAFAEFWRETARKAG